MARTRSQSPPAGAVFTLALASGAALLLGIAGMVGFRTETAESLFTLAWIHGWVLLSWAVIACVACVAHLGHRLLFSQRPAHAGTALRLFLLLASAAVITAVLWTHPWWGSGSGTG